MSTLGKGGGIPAVFDGRVVVLHLHRREWVGEVAVREHLDGGSVEFDLLARFGARPGLRWPVSRRAVPTVRPARRSMSEQGESLELRTTAWSEREPLREPSDSSRNVSDFCLRVDRSHPVTVTGPGRWSLIRRCAGREKCLSQTFGDDAGPSSWG